MRRDTGEIQTSTRFLLYSPLANRHEFGTKIYREKGIEFARRLLGHSNISTTQRYVHLDDVELADAQDLIE